MRRPEPGGRGERATLYAMAYPIKRPRPQKKIFARDRNIYNQSTIYPGVYTPLMKPSPTPSFDPLYTLFFRGHPRGAISCWKGVITPPPCYPYIRYPYCTLAISDSITLSICCSVALSCCTCRSVWKLSGIKSCWRSSNLSASEFRLRNILSMSSRAYMSLVLY